MIDKAQCSWSCECRRLVNAGGYVNADLRQGVELSTGRVRCRTGVAEDGCHSVGVAGWALPGGYRSVTPDRRVNAGSPYGWGVPQDYRAAIRLMIAGCMFNRQSTNQTAARKSPWVGVAWVLPDAYAFGGIQPHCIAWLHAERIVEEIDVAHDSVDAEFRW